MSTPQELQAIAEIQRVTGLNTIVPLDEQKFAAVIQAIDDGKLNDKHIESLIRTAPDFVEFQLNLTKEIVAFASTVSKETGSSQREAINRIVVSLEMNTKALEKISNNIKSDSTKKEIASLVVELAKIQVKNNELIYKMSRNNNNFWLTLAGIGAATVSIVAVIFESEHHA